VLVLVIHVRRLPATAMKTRIHVPRAPLMPIVMMAIPVPMTRVVRRLDVYTPIIRFHVVTAMRARPVIPVVRERV